MKILPKELSAQDSICCVRNWRFKRKESELEDQNLTNKGPKRRFKVPYRFEFKALLWTFRPRWGELEKDKGVVRVEFRQVKSSGVKKQL